MLKMCTFVLQLKPPFLLRDVRARWARVRTLTGEGDICAEMRAGAWGSWSSDIVGLEVGMRRYRGTLKSEAMYSPSWRTVQLSEGLWDLFPGGGKL